MDDATLGAPALATAPVPRKGALRAPTLPLRQIPPDAHRRTPDQPEVSELRSRSRSPRSPPLSCLQCFRQALAEYLPDRPQQRPIACEDGFRDCGRQGRGCVSRRVPATSLRACNRCLVNAQASHMHAHWKAIWMLGKQRHTWMQSSMT
eukprot:362856-Chlamydomonas_euryale.AAC.17